MLLQAKGGCCGSASATKGDPPPAAATARPAAPQQDGDVPPAHKQAASAAHDGPVLAAPAANTANGRSDNTHDSQQPAATAPAAAPAASAAATARQSPSQSEARDSTQPLDGERKMPRARPNAKTADKVAGLPTVGGQRRAQAIAAEASTGGMEGVPCHCRSSATCLHLTWCSQQRQPQRCANRKHLTLQGQPGMRAHQRSAAPATLLLLMESRACATASPQRALRSTGSPDTMVFADPSLAPSSSMAASGVVKGT
jgi:hypothetical protein